MTPFNVRLAGRSLAQVSGADAESFLNGLLTCEIVGMKPGEARYGAILTPQGKILFDLILLKLDHGYLIDCAGMQRDGLLQRLQFYKLRSKVDFGPVDGGIVAGVGDAPAGAVDAVGSTTLANVLSQINYGGAVAACGLAQGADLPASVMPFILRSVKLIGCDSVTCPMPRRVQAWARLATDLDRNKLAAMTHHIRLADVPKAAEEILAGKVRGRLVVDLA